ncbi:acyltransferase [Halioglobus japonicus]|uniref:HAD-IB family hydrolase n=1 Tax=Halioglobus japonicus TaxID=930805 RepID=A0AAP8MDF1_9GAMM|nr:HAD-IB family hydrolase [Halioglobus japonicus]AQA17668.1 acyltransferase [Halioglobus japonicus]PLW85614.1 HAD-IB family hydrolase [Halioglobus japonicus]GHD16556.1 acyltransferase [Halioglobus japonicus]
MANIDQLLEDIEKSPSGPQIFAIFDFDGTIISGFSATVFIREQVRRGDLSPREFVELMSAMTSFGMGSLGFSGMMAINAQFMRGIDEDTYYEVGEKLYNKQIARKVYPESRALIDAHIAKGHTVSIISSATPYQVEPAARDLDIEHVMCTHLEVANGKFTGSVVSPTCFGQGKVDAAEDLAAEVNGDLDQSFFYSDSTDDILLLERVGHPRPLNPSDKLERIAQKKHWPVAHFGSRGRPSLTQFVRSVAATSSLVTSFAAGLPIYALTGSRRASNNFSFSLFADTASALIGLDLNVKGEEHLWSHRPAVFVFNHQSKADVVICARLLRRDIAGIGKKEIKSEQPIIGKVMEMGGVVFIDRSNANSAIESMEPLVEAMQVEGKSVVLAPEGTRTVSPKLAPFKKGAFHIAMQAGVPMIPIVIRNAGDVAPKGDFVFRPATVDVEVLPPVDTSKWTLDSIDDHVRDVRNMFARALGQAEEPAPKKTATKKRKVPAKKKAAAKKPAAKKKAAPKSRAKPKSKAKQQEK